MEKLRTTIRHAKELRKNVRYAVAVAAIKLLSERAFPNETDQQIANGLVEKLIGLYSISKASNDERKIVVALLDHIANELTKETDITAALFMNEQANEFLKHVSNWQRKEVWTEVFDFSEEYLNGVFDRDNEFEEAQQVSDWIKKLIDGAYRYTINGDSYEILEAVPV